jgi:hypothetical protein
VLHLWNYIIKIKIYVDGTLRANAYWGSLACGTIYNGQSKSMEVTFPFDCIDVDFWDANRGSISYGLSSSYNVTH